MTVEHSNKKFGSLLKAGDIVRVTTHDCDGEFVAESVAVILGFDGCEYRTSDNPSENIGHSGYTVHSPTCFTTHCGAFNTKVEKIAEVTQDGDPVYLLKRYKKFERDLIERLATNFYIYDTVKKVGTLKKLTIKGRQWFHKMPATTYNSVQLILNEEHWIYLPMQGGYGDHYKQRAREFLVKHGLIDKEYSGTNLSCVCRELGIDYTEEIIDVRRQKDL